MIGPYCNEETEKERTQSSLCLPHVVHCATPKASSIDLS